MLSIYAGKGRVLITGPNGSIPKVSENVAIRLLHADGILFPKKEATHAELDRTTQTIAPAAASPSQQPFLRDARPYAGAHDMPTARAVEVRGRVPSVQVE